MGAGRCSILLLAVLTHTARAQRADLLVTTSGRTGSGTSWLPDAAAPNRHQHAMGWSAMLHGALFAQTVQTFGLRHDYQIGASNWGMVRAAGPAAGGMLRFQAMGSLEPLTLTRRGAPQLLQVAHVVDGAAVTDRALPQRYLMELAASFERAVSPGVGVSLYVAPMGEPALGPVSHDHRPSAQFDPTTPLGHHAQDDAHASFGVVTAGVFSRTVLVEVSAFNARQPADPATVLEYRDARFDAAAARVTVNPGPAWSVSASYGYLPATGGAHAHNAQHRLGAAALYASPAWSLAFVYGANWPLGASHPLPSALAEGTRVSPGGTALSWRVEVARRSAAELSLVGSIPSEVTIGALSLGIARQLTPVLAVGTRGTVHAIPAALDTFYGSRTPLAGLVYLRVSPPAEPLQHEAP